MYMYMHTVDIPGLMSGENKEENGAEGDTEGDTEEEMEAGGPKKLLTRSPGKNPQKSPAKIPPSKTPTKSPAKPPTKSTGNVSPGEPSGSKRARVGGQEGEGEEEEEEEEEEVRRKPLAAIKGDRPVCKYGPKCYLKDAGHKQAFCHPWV